MYVPLSIFGLFFHSGRYLIINKEKYPKLVVLQSVKAVEYRILLESTYYKIVAMVVCTTTFLCKVCYLAHMKRDGT